MKPYRIFIIAGEVSGDLIGAELIYALTERAKTSSVDIIWSGIGGPQMERSGLKTLFPMSDLSVMGFLEVLPHIPRILGRISQTVKAIYAYKPDMIITIDSPDFSFRVIKALPHCTAKKVHCVAPTVWAYRPKRAALVARLYDHLLTLLPFEAPYFEKEGMKVTYIGHPITKDKKFEDISENDSSIFKKQDDLDLNMTTIGVLPGSRKGEVERLWPIYEETLRQLHEQHPIQLIIPTVPALFSDMLIRTQNLPMKAVIVGQDEKYRAMRAMDVALTKSGTNTLELAMSGIPMVVTYKVNPITAWLAKRLVRVSYVTLINLVANAPIIPEFLLEKCTPKELLPALLELINNPFTSKTQREEVGKALSLMGKNTQQSPSKIASEALSSYFS